MGYTEAPTLNAINFTNRATNIVLVQEKENAVARVKTYHTKEGCRVGLCKAILASVPRKTITELVNLNSEFDKVEPHKLLVVIMRNADPATVVETATYVTKRMDMGYCLFGSKEIMLVPNAVVNSSNCIG